MEPDGNNKENLGQKMKNLKNKIIAAKVAILATVKILPILLIGGLVAAVVGTIVSFIVDIVTPDNTVKYTYETLDVEELCELVEIKENDDGEYYLDFIDGIDVKLKTIIEKLNSSMGVHNIPDDVTFLKELIKAEVITKFPDLGGDIPEGTTGFQGAVDLRRITPNKDIGELTNTAKGETSNIEQEVTYDVNESVGEYEEVVKGWVEGQELYLNADAIVFKQVESELNPGTYTDAWEEVYVEGSTNIKLKILSGTKVTYTGTYKNNTNAQTKVVTTYVEVKTKEITGFVKAQNLYVKKVTENETVSKIEEVETKTKVTSRAPSKTMGEPGKQYVVALSAGHNNTDNTGARNGDLIEEELTIKVAERVEELFEEYSNVKIVQTGSTSENPGGIKLEERTKLTRDANPDMAIAIHFNSSTPGGATGVEAIYKDGDNISLQFAEILSKNISQTMGLKDRGAGSDTEKYGKSLGIIENAATSGFPSVVTEGGFLNGIPDEEIIREDGVEKYAQGILLGIKEYIEADKTGYTATEITEQKVTESIESKVIKMKYVSQSKFEELVNNNSKDALKVFTLDKEDGYKVLTAKWSDENGTTKISQNTKQDLRTSLQKYTMPFEYLLYYYIDTDYKDFSMELAQKVVEETEIVMAIQDNITTTQQTDITKQEKVMEDDEYQESKGYDWKEVSESVTVTETCSTSIDFTYVSTWCVKTYKESSYSESVLNMGDKDEIVINLSGKVTETSSSTTTPDKEIKTGFDTIKYFVEELNEKKQKVKVQKEKDVNYSINEKTTTDVYDIYSKYEVGESKTDGNENIFVDLYQEHEMLSRVRENWLFIILKNDEKTSNLVDLTKYLMFKATSQKYGVYEYDFEGEYDLSKFNNISSFVGDIGYEFVKSWENDDLRRYMNGEITNYKYSKYIYNYVTEDKTQYICYDDHWNGGNRNYGFGVCHWSYKSKFHSDKITAYSEISNGAINIEDSQWNEVGVSLMDVNIVNQIGKNEYNRDKEIVRGWAEDYGITLKANELNVLADMVYQGFSKKAKKVCEYYADGNMSAIESTIKSAATGDDRGKARWIAFSTGVYYSRGWEEVKGSSSGEFLSVAESLWKEVCTSGDYYKYGGSSVPCEGPYIDCSAYVSWVMYEYGYTDFAGGQKSTDWWMNDSEAYGEKYGWEIIPVERNENPIDKLQPGDILVRRSGGSGHVQIVVYVEDGRVYAYDCGNTSANWNGTDGSPVDKTYFVKDSRPGKIIRVTAP